MAFQTAVPSARDERTGAPDFEPSAPGVAPDPLICPQCAGVKSLAARRCARCARGDPSGPTSVRLVAPSYAPRGLNAFRVYCVMCGRSTEVPAASRQLGRCSVCGGTQLTEDMA